MYYDTESVVFAFKVLVLRLEKKSTAQITDCTHLREQCINGTNGCDFVWAVLEDVCNVSGNDCKMKDTLSCNLSIQSLEDQYPKFKNCLCTEDIYCSVNKLLGRQCASKTGNKKILFYLYIIWDYIPTTEHSELPSAQVIQSDVIQWTMSEGRVQGNKADNDCSVAMQACQASEHCFMIYENFKETCGSRIESCSSDDAAGHLCITLREKLKESVLWDCNCMEPLNEDCIQIWKNIFESPCLQHAQRSHVTIFSEEYEDEYIQEDMSTDYINMPIKLQWDESTLPHNGFQGIWSCLEAARVCVGEVMCNKQLALYLKACSTTGRSCNLTQCQAAIRFFYQNMPFNIGQMLALCDCSSADVPCQKSKDVLHSNSCAVKVVPPPSCLDVIHSCRDDEICRSRYETFQSKCWQRVTEKCYYDETCINTFNKEDITCSADDKCKAAYIGTLGTILHVQCTCSSIPFTEQPLCEIFYHMLQSRSCFSKSSD
ncbi:GDNF family receptor alpha-like [Petaurus breviceps papuanus]|uniref:GDNF family receptor alpha-like n=1 Tax=Petaurus breviceps papuanus TaxID=3040969 RepID=UPI0036DCA148